MSRVLVRFPPQVLRGVGGGEHRADEVEGRAVVPLGLVSEYRVVEWFCPPNGPLPSYDKSPDSQLDLFLPVRW